jgi:uridine kinase
LANKLNSPFNVITLNSYFKDKLEEHKKYKKNWEVPESIDWECLKDHIQRLIDHLKIDPNQPFQQNLKSEKFINSFVDSKEYNLRRDAETVYIIVDGFLLFYDKSLCEMLNIKVFLDCDKDKCFEKKQKYYGTSSEFFNEMIWFYYQKFKPIQIKNAKPVHIDGNSTSEEFYKIELKNLVNHLVDISSVSFH